MKKNYKHYIHLTIITLVLLISQYTQARLGGGGGGGSHHSSGGDSGGGDGLGSLIWIIFRFLGFKGVLVIVVIYLIYLWYQKRNPKTTQNFNDHNEPNYFNDSNTQPNEFPEGLNQTKVYTAFTEMQNAWQTQNLAHVRKWMSDGLYQKLSVQIKMMQKLGQHNTFENLQIHSITLANQYTYNQYRIADVRIDFSMDDYFYSDQYPSMKQSFPNDYAAEYFTFIKKGTLTPTPQDNYTSHNCPNCGAALTDHLGEISRCPSCKTLTNNPDFDWVLCEITQENNYSSENHLNFDPELQALTQYDSSFSLQGVEDIASNIVMQIFDVITGGNTQKLERFATADLQQQLLNLKQQYTQTVFDRLYLTEVTVTDYSESHNQLTLTLYAQAMGKRVKPETNGKLTSLDSEVKPFNLTFTLVKNVVTQIQAEKQQVVYSYECPSCGAPYDDTTHDTCNYCGSTVVDPANNWVLNSFDWNED